MSLHKVISTWLVFGVFFSISEATIAQEPTAGTPDELKCEYGVNPMGVDVPQPRLSWVLHRNTGSTGEGYRILVATTPETLSAGKGDLWDSGWVISGDTSVAYAGKGLSSHQMCWWKVSDGVGWSEASSWTMGVLTPADWSGAKWIGAPDGQNIVDTKGPKAKYETVLLRDEFTVSSGVKRAVLDVCGEGSFVCTMNGASVTDDFLSPGWTQYNKTCLYCTYDVTKLIRAGSNALGLFLGNSMYLSHRGRYTKEPWSFGPLQAIAVLHLEMADGSVKEVVTDSTWKAHSGPITFSSIYGGEDYDAQLEVKGWDQPGCDVSGWDSVGLLNGPGGVLRGFCYSAPPLHTFEVFPPMIKASTAPTRKLYDFGQNAAIVIRLKSHGPAGSAVLMIPAELANGNGTANRGSAGGGEAWWKYTLSGTGQSEVYFPKFFYQGARFVQVDLQPNAAGQLPTVDSLEALAVHANCESLGNFSCSNELFNKIYTLVRWAQQNNMVSVMTDCPTRERLGWLEEDHLNGPALRYNFDLAQLFTKQENDMGDSQRSDGLVPSTCPDYPHWGGPFADSPEWGSSCILVPWQSYQFLGDTQILSRNYETMVRYVAFMKDKAAKDTQGGLLDYGLSDWYDIGPKGPGQSQLTPRKLSASAFYWWDTALLSKIAKLLHKDDDAKSYQELADQTRESLNKVEFNPQTNQYGMGSQAGNSMALVMGFADSAKRDAILANVVADVERNGLTAGDVGYRYLIRALADGGRSDLLFAINNQTDRPGYGMQLKRGATSLTEAWDGGSSQDHFMLGQINEWFFHDIAGIQPDDNGPGFKRLIIKPTVVGDLTSAKAQYKSIRGWVKSQWTVQNGKFTLEVIVPFGSTATIYVPTNHPTSAVVMSGKAQALESETDYAIFSAGGGNYVFTSDALASPPIGLTAQALDGKVKLNWSGSALNYSVQRSNDGIHFSTVGTNVTATDFEDASGTGEWVYRVCATDQQIGAEVHVTIRPPGMLSNSSFEKPAVVTYTYGVPNADGWVFDDRTGITPTKGDMWEGNEGSAPDGNQVAFVQMKGMMYQDLEGLEAGRTYVVKFMAAQRARYQGAGETWQLKIDDQLIGDFGPIKGVTKFAEFTGTFVAKSSKARLTFLGTDTNGGDNTVFIDDVRVEAK